MSFLRVDSGIVRGKKFTTRKRAAEYLWRIETNTLKCADGGGKLGLMFDPEFDAPNPLVNPEPQKHRPAPGGVLRRVYRHSCPNGPVLWRVTVENIWKSDHVSMEDALAGVRAIGIEPGKALAGVVVVPS